MRVLSKTNVYSGRVFNVIKETIEDEKGVFEVDIVEHPGAVVILPLRGDKIVMIKQYRYPVKETIYELPAGTIEPGEKPEECALRELEEETGFRAEKLSYLGCFYASPGYSSELLHAFTAENLHFEKQNLDIDEKIMVAEFSKEEVLDMINRGIIKDSKTLSALFLYFLKTKLPGAFLKL
ncbi:MAG: ADP-ribose pyrophosphatase [Thermoprotei archaeon]|nr:MAG: ADP-ribose pyrophosphatase [Thermoprotei archaeon]